MREIEEIEWSAARHKTRPKSRHMLIEERIQASTVPRNTTRRVKVKSIARVPPGSTLVSVIRKQAKRRKEIRDLFVSDSEKEQPARLWKRLQRNLTKVDVKNNN